MVSDGIAVVTGSTNNIGKQIAESLSEDGYHAVVTSRHGDEAKEVASEFPNEASGFEVDFSDPDDISELFESIDDLDGELSVLVNNVAHAANQTLLDCDLETWNEVINTNLRSYYLCSRHAAERMKDSGGSIVNITISREAGTTSKLGYSVSKGGVNMLTKSTARELAPHGIRVNAVGSGLIGTRVGERKQTREYENDRVPLGHIGEPADIAEAVRYLVSEEAKYVVGGMIPVDGGKEA